MTHPNDSIAVLFALRADPDADVGTLSAAAIRALSRDTLDLVLPWRLATKEHGLVVVVEGAPPARGDRRRGRARGMARGVG